MPTVSKSGARIWAMIATVAIGMGMADARADHYVTTCKTKSLYGRYVPDHDHGPAVSVTYAAPPAYLRYKHRRAPMYAIYGYRLPRTYMGYDPALPDPVYTTTHFAYEVPPVHYVSPVRYRRAVYHRQSYRPHRHYVSFNDYRPLRHHRVHHYFQPYLRSHRHRSFGVAISFGRPRYHRHERHHRGFSVRLGW